MKRSYLKIYIIELLAMSALTLNSFESSILRGYYMPLFLFGILVVSYFLLGYQKPKHRYMQDMFLKITQMLMIFFIVYYLSGIIITFARTDQYHNMTAMKDLVIPLALITILKEILRYEFISKSDNEKFFVIFTTIFTVFIDISVPLSIINFHSSYSVFMFLSETLLPSITANIFLSYLCLKSGYPLSIYYALIMKLYFYLFPIIPNPTQYIRALVDFIAPILFLFFFARFYRKGQIRDDQDKRNKVEFKHMIIPGVISITLVILVSGYFRYYAISIASNSMSPVFNKGDVVIIDQEAKNLKVGDIIALKKEGIIVVHRIIDIKKNKNENFYYTQGDANLVQDNFKTEDKDVVGTVKFIVPYIGYPTVMLSE